MDRVWWCCGVDVVGVGEKQRQQNRNKNTITQGKDPFEKRNTHTALISIFHPSGSSPGKQARNYTGHRVTRGGPSARGPGGKA